MGKKAKTSRKGKKAWRANIDINDIDKHIEAKTKDALSGGSLENVASSSLFFVDKTSDFSVKRKIEKYRQKVLRCESIFQKNAFIQPLPQPDRKISKKKFKISKMENQLDGKKKSHCVSTTEIFDMWDQQGEINTKRKTISKPSAIPAVEVEPPGCSFNPSFESHQESLANAVAEEMQKIYKTELGPKPVPFIVPSDAVSVDEEDKFFLEADDEEAPQEESDMDYEDMTVDVGKRTLGFKRVTRVERNRRARHKVRLRVEAEANKTKKTLRQIDCLASIIEEIAKEDEEKHERRLRRDAAKQERLKVVPPRLGKHRFRPAPIQVLLSEEVSGSLRKLKGCCTLARDRFKSFQKRGLLAPILKRSSYRK